MVVAAIRLTLTAALIVMVALGSRWALVTFLVLQTLVNEVLAIYINRLSPPKDEARLALLKRLIGDE